MKKQFKKWALRLAMTGVTILGLLLIIILNPILTYADKTTHNNFNIYHNKPLDPSLKMVLDEASTIVATSEFYNKDLKLDICLNESSPYTSIVKTLQEPAFAWGFYNKIVLNGTMHCAQNHLDLNNYQWNLTQLLAHEMAHCFQYNKLGFWHSNPIAQIPTWKWEGYAEYVSRQSPTQKDLIKNLDRLLSSSENSWEIVLEDATVAPRTYYQYWNLVQFCLEIQQMSYQELLSDTRSEEEVNLQMQNWYKNEKSKTI